MAKLLTSWKEIGLYLGKGVRTVQRWERDFDLPIHRAPSGSRRAIFAVSEELDAWARSHRRAPAGAVADSLRRDVAELRQEISDLSARLERLERRCPSVAVPH
jgi:uncharacterized protein YceH (UPF0502 family)